MLTKILMHFIITTSVIIGQYDLGHKVESINVNSSWQSLIDTATVDIPKNIVGLKKDTFKPGDRVQISTGYEGQQVENVFNGFVSKVSPQVPFKIQCEDAGYLLKQVNLKKTWKEPVTLLQVLQYIVDETNKAHPDYQISFLTPDLVPEINFEKFRFNNVNGAQALEKLKQNYGLVFYFRDLSFYAGLAYQEDAGRVVYNTERNVIRNRLTWRERDASDYRLKAIGILDNNEIIEAEVGEGGSITTKFFHDITDEETLKQVAEEKLDRISFSGYEGSLETFFIPFAKHSMIAEVTDPDFPDRSGSYNIDAVRYRMGNTIRITATLGKQV